MPLDSLRDKFYLPGLAIAVLSVAVVAALFALGEDPVDPLYALPAVVAVAYLFGTSLLSVRNHELYHLATTVTITLLFAFWWLTADRPAVIPALIAVLGVVGIAVELYNYVHDTTYLRFES